MGTRSFLYTCEDNKVYAKSQADPCREKFLVFEVTKNNRGAWAQYLTERLNLVDELRSGGLTNAQIRALARMTTNYRPTTTKEDDPETD